MYLSHTLVLNAFKRLRTPVAKDKPRKKPMERTSSLMIMLAVDATMKECSVETLDVDPSTTTGSQMRSKLVQQYSRLVSVGPSEPGTIQSVYELGFVKSDATLPESRISSNFLTTHVVKAADSKNAEQYPGRPAALLSIGKVATGMPHGIRLCPD